MLPALGIGRLVFPLCGVLIVSISLAACGDATPGTIVARVDRHSITKATLERWTAIEAVLAYETNPQQPVPRGVVPDPPVYVNCVSYLAAAGSPGGGRSKTAAQLKRQCAEEHKLLQHHILDILITYYWLSGDGAEKGVKLTGGEIKQVLDRIFPSAGAFHKYLSITGESPSDERLIIEKDLFDSKLLQLEETRIKKRKPTSRHQREQALIRAAIEFTKKWSARTSCSAGYVVSECKQYKGRQSLVEP
jgi:hypothetical protein